MNKTDKAKEFIHELMNEKKGCGRTINKFSDYEYICGENIGMLYCPDCSYKDGEVKR